jgi:hypothetical protein
VLRIDGALSRNTLETIGRLGLDGVSVLRISSSGGSDTAAIDLGEIVRRRNLKLVVADHCFRECAQYVFVAASTKVIEPGALVACGNNIIGAGLVPASAYGSPLSEQELRRRDRAQAFYRRMGAPEAFAMQCFHHVADCVATYRLFQEPKRLVRLSWRLWILTAADFRFFGIGGVQGARDRKTIENGWRFKWMFRRNARVGELYEPIYSETDVPRSARFLEREIPAMTQACTDPDRFGSEPI